MVKNYTITLPPFERGFHVITEYITNKIGIPETGLIHVFIKHTSAGLTINEAADPSVLTDFESTFNNLVPENQSHYTHIFEGSDDMPAHIKASLIGSSVSIPIINGQLDLGTWQGIYLGEFRNYGGSRNITISVIS